MAVTTSPDTTQFAQRATPRLRKRVARSLDDVDAWEGSWRDLEDGTESPFAEFAWSRACLSAFPAATTPHFVAGFADQELAALVPLVKCRKRGVCRLFSPGDGQLFEPIEWPRINERVLAQSLRSVANRGWPLELERVRTDSETLRAVTRAYRGRGIVVTRPQRPSPYIALDESWLTPDHRLALAARDELAQARHVAEQFGPVSTEIHTPDLRELAELLDTAIDVESRTAAPAAKDLGFLASVRIGGATVPLARDPQQMVFYRQYARAACIDGTLRICFLRLGDAVAAMQLAVEQADAFWLLRSGFDARFADAAPSQLLTHETIRYAAEAGLQSYEFGNVVDQWTGSWTTTGHDCVSLRTYPFGFRGVAAVAMDHFAGLV